MLRKLRLKIGGILVMEWSERKMGYITPRGYGVAWYDPSLRAYYLSPMPLNFLIGWIRSLYFRLMEGPRNLYINDLENQISEDHNRGWAQGYRDGMDEAIREFEKKLRAEHIAGR